MGIRVSNTSQQNFGTAGAATTVTHGRVQTPDGTVTLLKQFTTPINVQQSNALIVNAGAIRVNHAEGDAPNNYVQKLVEGFWGASGTNTFNVDLMVSSSAVVTVSGYQQQAVSAWTIATY